ncbi:Putative hydrolase [Durusdinium trenchii]|uniref:Hydrolase n=1 Tax=Durusdinium trenchii TaxID=1381693 RepID=A0ABP0R078_9DINO
MAWDFNLDFSQPRKGPATPAFSGDWRGGTALHQAPQVEKKGAKERQRGPVVENDSDEEALPAEVSEKPQVQLIWDAAKGQLVPSKEGEPADIPKEDGTKVDEKAPAEEANEGDAESEEEEEADADDEVNVEAESRNAFLAEASTPELIKQAVAVSGPLADSTKDKWVLDQATQLYFKYDSASQKMPGNDVLLEYLPRLLRGSKISESKTFILDHSCMYHWKERGKMTFLWATPAGAGTAPPSQMPNMPSGPSESTEAERRVHQGGNCQKSSSASMAFMAKDLAKATASVQKTEGDAALWVTMIPPQVLTADFEDANAQAEEELELNAKAMGAVIGKGGKGIKEIEQATGVKSTTLNAREDAQGQRRLLLQGTKTQILAAKSAVEQRIVMVLGLKMAEKVQKHWSQQLLEKKRTETGSEAAKSGVRGLSDFALEHGLKAVMARKLAKLDAQLQRYLIRHFKPMKAKPANALRGYMAQLFKFPQRWRLEALYEDGELDGEICETIPLRSSAVIGRAPEEGEEQVIEAEVNMALGPKEASKLYGDVQDQHCKLHRMGNDFYVMALESQIGTLVDGQKIRHTDGPVALRDGTTLGVGKYLFYCEVGSETFLQERRKKLLAGERFWKEGSASLQQAESEARQAEAKKASSDVEEADAPEAEDEDEDEEALDVLFTDGSAQENEELVDKSLQNEEQLDAAERKREAEDAEEQIEEPPEKRMKTQEEDAPMPGAVVDEVEELAEVAEAAENA